MHPDLGYATALIQHDELVELAAARRLTNSAHPGRRTVSERVRDRFGASLMRLGARLQRRETPDDIASLRALHLAR